MTTSNPTRQGLLRRLLRNRAGNVIVLTGAAMVPMAALAGSAVDMSRLYLVRARLQQACDAGALAGRRFMTGTTFNANAQAQANTYFNFNFPDGAYGVTSRSFTPSRTANGQVAGVASATVPMVVMHMFGMEPKTLGVECEAKFEVANTDVVFVLDTTGSMACDQADDTATCNAYATQSANTVQINGRWQTRQRPDSRIKALRAAIKDFYDVLNGAVSSDARLRFGFVPYSSSVNVGREIMDVNAAYISDAATYQSRRRVPDGKYVSSGSSTTGWSRVSSDAYGAYRQVESIANTSRNSCDAKVPNPNPERQSSSAEYQQGNPRVSVQGDTETTVVTYRRTGVEAEYRVTWGTSGQRGTSRTCIVERRLRDLIEERTATSTRQATYQWRYEPISFDTSRFKRGDAVTTRTGDVADDTAREGAGVTTAWSGCIQERDTIAGSNVDVGDSGAHDLDIDGVPNDAATRWRPSWPQITYNRGRAAPLNSPDTFSPPSTENTRFSCPKAAAGLRTMTLADINAYVDASDFIPHGGTYHDIGLLWGARLSSPTGIFGADHGTPPNGGSVQRHIIFMTDGDMSPTESSYSTYGTELMEGRIGSNDRAELKRRHNYRFESICRAIRDRNVTLWVVAYGQEMTPELSNCATPGLAFSATNAAQLQAQFRQIAAQIAELRLDR